MTLGNNMHACVVLFDKLYNFGEMSSFGYTDFHYIEPVVLKHYSGRYFVASAIMCHIARSD